MALRFVDETSGETFAIFGGRWDRLRKQYTDDDPKFGATKKLHPGQMDAARWFDEWLARYQDPNTPAADRVYDSLLLGGRRSGKSDLMFAEVVAFALAEPGSIVWCVVPTEGFLTEPAKYLEKIMPRAWYKAIEKPSPAYFLANGSQIFVRSGHIARKLKQGEANFIAINEGQALIGQSYDTLSASIVDTGGLIVTAANPPDVGDPGDWVADLAAETERGDRRHARTFFLDPLLNPHIDQVALAALAEKYDQHTFDVQIRGLLLQRPDTVLHSWNRIRNERAVPDMGDCTAQFTKHFEGTELNDIISIDVQSYPWLVGIRLRAFRNPLAPEDMEQAFLWGVGEVFVDEGDEVDLGNRFKEQRVFPAKTLTIMDASCDWQQAERDITKQRADFKGKGSMDMMRAQGFRFVVPPDRYMKKNPEIADRCRAANARIGTKSGEHWVYVDPHRCPRTVESISKWKTKTTGLPSRTSRSAHAGDALSYAIWRFFPRRRDADNVTFEKLPPRFGGRDRLKGF